MVRSSTELRSLSAEQFHWLMQRDSPLTRSSTISHLTVPSDPDICAKQRTFFLFPSMFFHVLCTAFRDLFRSIKRFLKALYSTFLFGSHLFSGLPTSCFSCFSSVIIFTFQLFSRSILFLLILL